MPCSNCVDLHYRPNYGFEPFDSLLDQLKGQTDRSTRSEILTALEWEGRHLDVKALASLLSLVPELVEVVRLLAAFGDRGEVVHVFAAVPLARITSGSLLGACDLTTYLFARRCRGQIEYFWRDENDATEHDLGTRDQPLSLVEAIVMVDAVLVAQAPHDVVGGDWRTGYFCDDSMVVSVASEIYPGMREWYRRVVSEWNDRRDREE